MTKTKEIGSKKKKKIVSQIVAPSISDQVIFDSIQFIAEDQENVKELIYNRKYEVTFFRFENKYYPVISFIRENPTIDFPSVQVDEGALTHILNGADIFTQGITSVSRKFEPNTIVMIINPQNTVISLGKSIMSSEDLLVSKGKGILNIHYITDDIWNGKI